MLQMYAGGEETSWIAIYLSRLHVNTCARAPTREDARTACPVTAECRIGGNSLRFIVSSDLRVCIRYFLEYLPTKALCRSTAYHYLGNNDWQESYRFLHFITIHCYAILIDNYDQISQYNLFLYFLNLQNNRIL